MICFHQFWCFCFWIKCIYFGWLFKFPINYCGLQNKLYFFLSRILSHFINHQLLVNLKDDILIMSWFVPPFFFLSCSLWIFMLLIRFPLPWSITYHDNLITDVLYLLPFHLLIEQKNMKIHFLHQLGFEACMNYILVFTLFIVALFYSLYTSANVLWQWSNCHDLEIISTSTIHNENFFL